MQWEGGRPDAHPTLCWQESAGQSPGRARAPAGSLRHGAVNLWLFECCPSQGLLLPIQAPDAGCGAARAPGTLSEGWRNRLIRKETEPLL